MEWGGDARLAAGPEATWYLETAFTPGARLGTVYDDITATVIASACTAGPRSRPAVPGGCGRGWSAMTRERRWPLRRRV